MIVRCYGARGSIPVSGRQYVKYGGDTTCLEIRDKNDEILIVDAGSGIRRLGDRLLEEGRYEYHLIFTHSHLDHIIGFPFFMPIFHEKTRIHLMGCGDTQGNLKKILSRATSPPYFPVPFDGLEADIAYSGQCIASFHIGEIECFPIPLSHTNPGQGYRFVEDGKAFVFLTDNELGFQHKGGLDFDAYADFAKEADLLIHDAEYTPDEYQTREAWGHSHYIDAANLALAARVRRFGLFHHNRNHSDGDIDRMVDHCRDIAAENRSEMECFALSQDSELLIPIN